MPPTKPGHTRVTVDIPHALHRHAHTLCAELRTELGMPRRTDVGLATVLLALLHSYTDDPDLRKHVRLLVRAAVLARSPDAGFVAAWRARTMAENGAAK